MAQSEKILETGSSTSAPVKSVHEHETVALARDTVGNVLPGEPIRNVELADKVPGCKLLSILGSGGMGTVYLARQENLNRLVAVKVLNSHFAANSRFADSLSQEALTMGALSHPNIVSCHDVFTNSEGMYIIMEYVPGRLTGRDLVLRLGRLPENMVVEIMLQTVRALAYVHSKGFIHRDLKPDNLLIYREAQYPPRNFEEVFSSPDSRVMICDFGIAAGAQKIADGHSDGILFGSPAFMAPEQAFAPEKVDFRADIYALAATAWFLLTGVPPFEGHDRDSRLLLKAENDIPDPILANGKKPCRQFLNVLRKMGAADPDKRYQDYKSLIADLEYLSLFYADREKRLPQGLMRRKRSFFFGLGLGVFGICLVAGIIFFQRYMASLTENNSISKTISLIFWEGERDGWRIFQKDVGTDQPSLLGSQGAGELLLRETLLPGQSVKFSIRLLGAQSSSISLLDEKGQNIASFAFYGFRNSKQLLIRMSVDQDKTPIGKTDLTTELDWTNIKISVKNQQVWFYVNGELRGFRHLEDTIENWRLKLDDVRSTYIQLKDFFVVKMDNGNGY